MRAFNSDTNSKLRNDRLGLLHNAFGEFLESINCRFARLKNDFNSRDEYLNSNEYIGNVDKMLADTRFYACQLFRYTTGKKDSLHLIYLTSFEAEVMDEVSNSIYRIDSVFSKMKNSPLDDAALFNELHETIINVDCMPPTGGFPRFFSAPMKKLIQDSCLIVGIHLKQRYGLEALSQCLHTYINKRSYATSRYLGIFTYQLTCQNIRTSSALVTIIDNYMNNPSDKSLNDFFKELASMCKAALLLIEKGSAQNHVKPGKLHKLLNIFKNEDAQCNLSLLRACMELKDKPANIQTIPTAIPLADCTDSP